MGLLRRNKGIIYFYLVLIVGTMFLIYENEKYQMKEEENLHLIVQK